MLSNKRDHPLLSSFTTALVHKEKLLRSIYTGASLRGMGGVPLPPGLRGCRQFLEFCALSANLETFCFRKYFVGNISRPIRKSASFPQQRDIEHPLDTNKDGRM